MEKKKVPRQNNENRRYGKKGLGTLLYIIYQDKNAITKKQN